MTFPTLMQSRNGIFHHRSRLRHGDNRNTGNHHHHSLPRETAPREQFHLRYGQIPQHSLRRIETLLHFQRETLRNGRNASTTDLRL